MVCSFCLVSIGVGVDVSVGVVVVAFEFVVAVVVMVVTMRYLLCVCAAHTCCNGRGFHKNIGAQRRRCTSQEIISGIEEVFLFRKTAAQRSKPLPQLFAALPPWTDLLQHVP